MAAANLADRYISDRYLPDKAIDLIDEAGLRLRIKRMQAPPDLREIERKLNDVQEAKPGSSRSSSSRRPAASATRRRRCSRRGPPRSARSRPTASTCSTRSTRKRSPKCVDLDGHPGLQADRGRDPEADQHGGRAPQADHRPGERGRRRLPVDPPHAPASRIPSGRAARSSSWAPPASARPSSPRPSPSSCSATRSR